MTGRTASTSNDLPTGIVLVGEGHGFVPLFGHAQRQSELPGAPGDREVAEQQEAMRRAEIEQRVRRAEQSGLEKGLAAGRAAAQAEKDALKAELSDKLDGVVERAALSLAEQARDAVARCEATMAQLIRRLLGGDNAGLLSAALLSQIGAALNAAAAPGPVTVRLAPDDHGFVTSRAPGFVAACARRGIAVEADVALEAHTGRIAWTDGASAVDIGAFVDRIVGALEGPPSNDIGTNKARC